MEEQGHWPRPATRLVGVALCGGESRRMGTDKARLRLAGNSLLELVIERLERICGRVVLACGSQARYSELGRELVLDDPRLAGRGPIAGILGALDAFEAERFLVLACDLPRADGALLEALVLRAEEERLDACLFESARGPEPLCAVYARTLRHPMRAALAAGEGRVIDFLRHPLPDGRALRAGWVREEELGGELAAADPAFNLNTPAELELERRRWEAGA